MNPEQAMVKEWHERFGVLVQQKPGPVSQQTQRLRESLIYEEWKEFRDSGQCLSRKGEHTNTCDFFIDHKRHAEISDVADALADLLYVVNGSGVSYGIDLEPIFREVHRSNMSKGDPEVVKAPNGKILKSKNFSPPNLEPILSKMGEVVG